MPLETPQQGLQRHRPLVVSSNKVVCNYNIMQCLMYVYRHCLCLQVEYLCALAASTGFLSPAGPSKPLSVSLSLLSDTSIMVEWARPALDGGDAAITYTITLQGGPGAKTKTRTKTPSSMNTTFTGLEAPNTYTVQVAAVNSAGTSPPVEGTILFQGNLDSHVSAICGSLIWNCSERADICSSYFQFQSSLSPPSLTLPLSLPLPSSIQCQPNQTSLT